MYNYRYPRYHLFLLHLTDLHKTLQGTYEASPGCARNADERRTFAVELANYRRTTVIGKVFEVLRMGLSSVNGGILQ